MNKLNNSDYGEAATFLKCEIRAIKAVAIVESGGRGGFDEKGRVLIRFEGHKFRSFTNGKYDISHPHVSYRYHKSHRNCGNIHGYTAFNEAMKLDPLAAMKSCSIGMFQPMVFNYHEMGYSSVHEMWDDFRKGEREQLLAFCRLIKRWGLDDELRRATLADFTVFARVYNGADFRANDYHNKMHRYYVNYKPEKNAFQDLREDEISFNLPDQSLSNPAEFPPNNSSDYLPSEPVGEVSAAQESEQSAPASSVPEQNGQEANAGSQSETSQTWLNVEDWKPWVFSKLKWVWSAFSGANFAQFSGNTFAAMKDSENWWIYLAFAGAILLISLIICAVISLILLAIWYFNRKEIKEYFHLSYVSKIDPNLKNLGLKFEKIQ